MIVIGIVGWKNSGKTRLIKELIKYFSSKKYKVATIKHAHHGFEIDKPGKDSYRHRSSGAKEVLVASSNRWALMHELADESEPSLKLLLDHMSDVDLVIVEGYKNQVLNKIEINRSTINKPLIAGTDNSVIAIASDKSTKNIENLGLPVLNLDDTSEDLFVLL